MCMCVCSGVCASLFAFANVHVRVSVCACVSVSLCAFADVHVRVSASVCACVSVSLFAFAHVHVRVCLRAAALVSHRRSRLGPVCVVSRLSLPPRAAAHAPVRGRLSCV
jgi:hypothetical protein